MIILMKVFLSIKYHEDMRNRVEIEHLLDLFEACGHSTFCVVRDLEGWGVKRFDENTLMRLTLNHIRESHLVVVETTEKGMGLGIEAGYAHARGIRLIAIAWNGSDISPTLSGIAEETFLYSSFEELREFVSRLAPEG